MSPPTNGSDTPEITSPSTSPNLAPLDEARLLDDVRLLVRQARERMAVAVNSELTLLYWHLGKRIRQDLLSETRATYGQRILATLSQELTHEFGKGFAVSNLSRMMTFAEDFPDVKEVQGLANTLTWSHFIEILPQEDPLKRAFYLELCRLHRWSVRTLRERVRGMLFERTSLSRLPEETIQQELDSLREEDRMTPDMVFRNPYVLTALGLPDVFSERDLENAILRDMEAFLLELGDGFAFVSRQKRMVIDDKDFKLDLLMYHRKLKCLVAIDLKLGEFEPGYKGQMELYLSWLDRNEREKAEEAPIGLILCEKAGPQQISLLQLDRGNIRVAEYLTQSLPAPLLEQKLREAILRSREQLATHSPPPALPSGGEVYEEEATS